MPDKGGGGGSSGTLGRGGASAAQPDSLSARLFGGPANVTIPANHREGVARVSANLFGRALSEQELAGMVAAPAGAKVRVTAFGNNEIHFSTSHPDYQFEQMRQLRKDAITGELVMNNESFFLNDDAPAGMGTRIFAKQVQTLRAAGVSRIGTLAARATMEEDDYVANGHYTWARLGYDGKLPRPLSLPPNLRGATRVSELMRTPEGRSYWKAKGESMNMEFDLNPGSLSSQILNAYTTERGVTLP